MQRRLRLESGTKLDVVRAEQDANLARNSVVSSDEALRQAREALGLALGSAEPYGVSPNISLDAVARDAGRICNPAKPDDRADVRAARADLEVAERGVTDVKLGYLPTAAVSSIMSYGSEVLVPGKHYAWSIQGVISWTIWDGGSRYGESRTANAGVAQGKERVEVARRGATLESSQATRGIQVAEQARVLAEQGRDLAKETARLSQVAFEAGNATSFDLVESARRQREAELNLAVREFDLVKAKITALLASASCTY
jgi:outer membrane protein TolC